ncbi:hypothetical protein D3C87_85220 [compost metagenome]
MRLKNKSKLFGSPMNGKGFSLILSILLPVSAFAHGQEVLASLFYDLMIVIVLIIFIACIKWKSGGKVLLALVLVISLLIPLVITGKWPYQENKKLIDLLCVGIPLLSVLLTYFIFRRKFALK